MNIKEAREIAKSWDTGNFHHDSIGSEDYAKRVSISLKEHCYYRFDEVVEALEEALNRYDSGVEINGEMAQPKWHDRLSSVLEKAKEMPI